MIRRRLFRLAAVVAALFVLLAGVEKVGRSFPRVMPPQWQRLHSAIERQANFKPIPDPEIGWLSPAGPDTDSKGFPNKEPWPAHADIVFLGDSLLTGPGVGLAGNFTSLVARLLPDQRIINLGLGAAGVERQIPVFRRFGVPLRPRVVVACLYLASDFENDARFRTWVRDGHGEDFFTYRSPGDTGSYVSAMTLFRRFQWNRLLEQSWLYMQGRDLAIGLIKGRDAIEERYRFPDGTETLLARGLVEFANAQTNAHDPRIDSLLVSLEHLQMLVREQDATLLVALIPSFEELFRERAGADRGNVMAHTRSRLDAAGFMVLDLYPSLRAGGRMQTPYVKDDIHLNAYGQQIVAHEFVAWFQHAAKGGRFHERAAMALSAAQ